jgi:hypothetical protein
MTSSRFSGDENGFTLELTPRLSPVHYWTHLLKTPSESLFEAAPQVPRLPLRIEVAWRLEENGFGDFESYLLSREIRFFSEEDDEEAVDSIGPDRRGGRRDQPEPSPVERAARGQLPNEGSTTMARDGRNSGGQASRLRFPTLSNCRFSSRREKIAPPCGRKSKTQRQGRPRKIN